MLWSHRGSITATQFCFCTEESHRQVAVCSKCCSTSDHWDSVVRVWSVTANAWWPALADCSSEAAVQARRDAPSLSSTPGSKPSRWLLCACVWSSRSPASMICRASSTVCSTCSLHHVCKPCFFCRRTNSLEFTARWFAWSSCWLRTCSVRLQNTSLHWTLPSVSALECITLSRSTNAGIK